MLVLRRPIEYPNQPSLRYRTCYVCHLRHRCIVVMFSLFLCSNTWFDSYHVWLAIAMTRVFKGCALEGLEWLVYHGELLHIIYVSSSVLDERHCEFGVSEKAFLKMYDIWAQTKALRKSSHICNHSPGDTCGASSDRIHETESVFVCPAFISHKDIIFYFISSFSCFLFRFTFFLSLEYLPFTLCALRRIVFFVFVFFTVMLVLSDAAPVVEFSLLCYENFL